MNKGFSLVELSIVLVILGLLTGGILSGQSLIRAAELRSVMTEYQNYQTAVNSFRDQHFALPGDMRNAASFWPAAANGNGDNILDQAPAVSVAGERYGFWQQLALAGLVEGNYTGLATAVAVDDVTLGTNIPKSKLSNAGWSLFYLPTTPITDMSWFAGIYDNIFLFGNKSGTSVTVAPALTPEEAWNIDTKADDGKPAMGSIRTREIHGHATTGCSNPAASATAIEATAAYDLDNTATACSFIMRVQ